MEEAFGLPSLGAATEEEYLGLAGLDATLGGASSSLAGPGSAFRLGGAAAMQKMIRTRTFRPDVVVAAHENTAKQELGVLSLESWSWERHAKELVTPHCPRFRTLRRILIAIAHGLDLGRTASLEEMQAYMHQLYRVLEAAAKDGGGHDLTWGWPLLGVTDPDDPRPRPGWAPAELAALNAYHKEVHSLETVRQSYLKGKGGGRQEDLGGEGGGKGNAARKAAAEAKKKKGAAAAGAKAAGRGHGGGGGGGGAAAGGGV
jgi:hypothetical protein